MSADAETDTRWCEVDSLTTGLVKLGLNFSEPALLELRSDLLMLVDKDSGLLSLVRATSSRAHASCRSLGFL